MHMFTALHKGVYVWCVYRSNNMYSPTVVLYIMKLCVFSYYKTQFHYVQKQWKQAKMFVNKNHASKVGEKSTETRNMRHLNIHHSGLLRPHFTLSTIMHWCTKHGPTKCQSLHVKCSLAMIVGCIVTSAQSGVGP